MKKSVFWVAGYFIIVIAGLYAAASQVVRVDPYMHYHEPLTDEYFYKLDNQRSINDGIARNFEYQGLITGTSMTECFSNTQAEELFGMKFIKTCFSGGTFKEIHDYIDHAADRNKKLRVVIRGLDLSMLIREKDAMRTDMGVFPDYLYDDDLFNDANYVFNRDVLFSRIYGMEMEKEEEDFEPGITTFDKYSNWTRGFLFGKDAVLPDGIPETVPGEPQPLNFEERQIVFETVNQNLASLPREHPNVTFYYFFTPYSVAWWQEKVNDGTIYKQVQAERIYIEELIKYDNVKLYSFNCIPDITTDLNNYKDTIHYGEWINSLMLRYMRDEKFRITQDTYEQYLESELELYLNFDYSSLEEQVDNGDDFKIAEKFYEEANKPNE